MWHKGIFAVLSLLVASSAPAADLTKGQEAYDSGDYETALNEWRPLAEAGNADAQFGIGLMYSNGFGVSMDDSEAVKWYLLAADQGHGMAQNNLGVLYANGWGVPQSDEEAFKWYDMAANTGVVDAQRVLADRYASGIGIGQNKAQAYKWLSIATELGDLDAQSARDELAAGMSAEDVAEGQSLANAWLQERGKLVANQ